VQTVHQTLPESIAWSLINQQCCPLISGAPLELLLSGQPLELLGRPGAAGQSVLGGFRAIEMIGNNRDYTFLAEFFFLSECGFIAFMTK